MSEETTAPPGPWRISGCRVRARLLVIHGDEDTFSPLIAEVHSDDGRLPQQANARLIAAAPDLLDALRDIVRAEWTAVSLHDMTPQHRTRLERARAAIAKAEGSQS